MSSSEDWREREDRIDRRIEFIIEQQAQAEVRAAAAAERWARQEERWAQADERWNRTEEGIRALLSIAEIHESEIGELRDASVQATKSINALREAGEATDGRLNALISVVDRQISKGRNGKQ